MSLSVDWSELPPELHDSIAKKLIVSKDYVRFRAVCSDFRNATPEIPKHLPTQLPWLMLPRTTNQDPESKNRNFLSISDDKVHLIDLPEDSDSHRRCGSSYGWLVTLQETPTISIFNPLTRARQYLPPLSSFPNVTRYAPDDIGREYTLKTLDDDVYTCNSKEMRDSYIKKLVFSSSPSNVDVEYYALAILNQTGDLAYCKKGDQCWKFIDDANSFCEDVVYYKGCFYAVSKHGTIAMCDVNGDQPKVSFIDTPRQVGGDMQYLVIWKDELLLVTRYTELEFNMDQNKVDIVYRTTEFHVYKLVLNGPKWESMSDLDGWALFLGENSSMAFCASDFPGCKRDCIYFTDDYSEWNYDGANGNHDLGIFDMGNGNVDDLPCYRENVCNGRRWPPPIWFTPSLH
ncbi:F-box protein SKIP23-like [Rutidosis leptorrhynchoides]|uniref:F-box protein SKIP23-like n=1 Tax=Rutidosis leptorrhynchoides TaxID=125765 RepID=UPI003A9947C9